MFSLVSIACLLCEAFLLRFLWELGKARRDARRERTGKRVLEQQKVN